MAPKEGEECSQRGAREEQESLQSPKEERAARTRKKNSGGQAPQAHTPKEKRILQLRA